MAEKETERSSRKIGIWSADAAPLKGEMVEARGEIK